MRSRITGVATFRLRPGSGWINSTASASTPSSAMARVDDLFHRAGAQMDLFLGEYFDSFLNRQFRRRASASLRSRRRACSEQSLAVHNLNYKIPEKLLNCLDMGSTKRSWRLVFEMIGQIVENWLLHDELW